MHHAEVLNRDTWGKWLYGIWEDTTLGFFFSGCPGGGWGCLPLEGGEQNCCVMKTCDEALCLLHGGASKLQNHNSCPKGMIHKLPTLFQKPCHIMPYPIPAWLRRDYLKTVVVGQDFTLFDVFSPLIFEKKRPNEKAQTFPVGCVWGFLKMKHCRMDKQFLCVAQRDSIRLNENHAVSKYHPFLTIWYISSSYTTIPHFMGQSVSKDYNRYDIP